MIFSPVVLWWPTSPATVTNHATTAMVASPTTTIISTDSLDFGDIEHWHSDSDHHGSNRNIIGTIQTPKTIGLCIIQLAVFGIC